MKERAIIKVTYEMLEDLLKLKKDVKIIDVLSERIDRCTEIIGIKVTGDNLWEKPEGCEITWINLGDTKINIIPDLDKIREPK